MTDNNAGLPVLRTIDTSGFEISRALLREAAAFQIVAHHRDKALDEARREADDWRKVAEAIAQECEVAMTASQRALERAMMHLDHARGFYKED